MDEVRTGNTPTENGKTSNESVDSEGNLRIVLFDEIDE